MGNGRRKPKLNVRYLDEDTVSDESELAEEGHQVLDEAIVPPIQRRERHQAERIVVRQAAELLQRPLRPAQVIISHLANRTQHDP